jgi:hypothetical protein
MMRGAVHPVPFLLLAAALLVPPATAHGQDRLRTYPGYTQYERMAGQMANAVEQGSLNVSWIDGGRAFEYQKDGAWYRYDVDSRTAAAIAAPTVTDPRPAFRGGVERGRQFDSATSPAGNRLAFYKDRNLWLADADGSNERAITTEGDLALRSGPWPHVDQPAAHDGVLHREPGAGARPCRLAVAFISAASLRRALPRDPG